MRLALAQINTVVGDIDGNRGRILARLEEARAAGADLPCFRDPPQDPLAVPLEVADDGVDLRERQPHGTNLSGFRL